MAYLMILSTFTCVVDILTAFIIKFILSWFYTESDEDKALRKDLITLKKEMDSISMVDKFAKYAKLQRRYYKLEDQAKGKINDRLASRTKVRLSLTYGVRILNGIFTSVLLFMYRKEPVLIFPKGSLWPLETILGWPTSVEGAVSLPIWIMLVKVAVSCLNVNGS